MIELVLVYCLASHADQCVQQREVREPMATPITCAMQGQTLAQQFVASHPRFRLQGWRCEVDRPRQVPA